MSEERCDYSDLPKSTCAHCRPEAPQVDAEKPILGTVIMSRIDSKCTICGEDIVAGEDHIGKLSDEDGGGWAHYGCGR